MRYCPLVFRLLAVVVVLWSAVSLSAAETPEPLKAGIIGMDAHAMAWTKILNAMPEEWIRALGKTIVKIHVKDFKLNPDGHGGDWAAIREGSVNWPLVRKELDKVGYNGWMTIEGARGLSLEEQSERLDLIIAGK